jgi:hypothetical protein
MIKRSCYSFRNKFEPSALKVSYSKNYCECCSVELFGEDYLSFARKSSPTTQKNLAIHFAELLFAGTCLLLWLSIGQF